MSTNCPSLTRNTSFRKHCAKHRKRYPNCSKCVSKQITVPESTVGNVTIVIDGARTGTTGPLRPADYYRLSGWGEWIELTPAEYEQMAQERAELEASLSQDPVDRSLALAGFYRDRGLTLMRIQMLDDALYATTDQPDVHVAEELACALQEAGFPEAALHTWDYVPTIMRGHDIETTELLGNVMLNRGRVLDSLQRTSEAEAAFAAARHMLVISGQMRR